MEKSFGDRILVVVEKQHICNEKNMSEENLNNNDISCVENNIPNDAEIISNFELFSQEPKRGGEGNKTDRNHKRNDL